MIYPQISCLTYLYIAVNFRGSCVVSSVKAKFFALITCILYHLTPWLIDLCDFWHAAKRRSHQAIQRIYINVHQQKLKIK